MLTVIVCASASRGRRDAPSVTMTSAAWTETLSRSSTSPQNTRTRVVRVNPRTHIHTYINRHTHACTRERKRGGGSRAFLSGREMDSPTDKCRRVLSLAIG